MAANSYAPGAPACFKAYDIRGVVPCDIDEEFARALGCACARAFQAKTVVIGHDARLSSPALSKALADGLAASGIQVQDLGLCGTEEIYYAAANGDFDLGIMITGSHNPADQNGFKFVRRGAIPVSSQSGLADLEKIMRGVNTARQNAPIHALDMRPAYLDFLCDYANLSTHGRRLRVVANAGNGCAGPVLEQLAGRLPVDFIPLNYVPDGNFPNGVPNPLLPERRADTSQAVKKAGADLGVAFDGDFDRCFFFDEDGNFIEGYYLVGILASSLLAARPGEKIIHDPRLYWNTQDMVRRAGGTPIMGKTGHAFMKEKMRAENALYGGEMSAHHYFRDFAYCDSGMLTMLLALSFLQGSGASLAEAVASCTKAFPCSGELNFTVEDPGGVFQKVWERFVPGSVHQDRLDGMNVEHANWRFSLRSSNTEPLVRLNVESRGDTNLMAEKTGEIVAILES